MSIKNMKGENIMTFPNALAGIKKIFTAEILAIAGTVLAGIGGVMLAAAAVIGNPVEAGFGAIFAAIGLVVIIVSYIMNLVGLYQAGKDERKYFRTAFILSIAALVLSIVGGIAQSAAAKEMMVFGLITDIINIVVAVLVISGIMLLADKCLNEKVKKMGKNILIMWVIIYAIALVLKLIPSQTSAAAVLAGVSAILLIVVYIIYLVYLSRAIKMLKGK